MRWWAWRAGPRLALVLAVWLAAGSVAGAAAVDVRFDRAPVHEVLRVLAEAEGLNVIIDEGVACEVSMSARGLEGAEAIELVAGVCGLYLEQVGRTLVVSNEPKGLSDKVGRQSRQELKFTERPVGEVLQALAERAGWNLIAEASLDREVTAWLEGMEPVEALRLVAAAAGLRYQLVDRVLHIKGVDGQEDRVVIHRLDHVAPDKARELVETFVPGPRVEVDSDTRSLVVSGSEARLDEVARFLAEFDTARPQVLVEARILEVAVDVLETLGVEWPQLLPLAGSGTPQAFEFIWNPDQLQATLRSLADRGRSKVLASPKISAVDGESAEMLIGDRVPIVTEQVDADGRVSQSVEFMDVGISLEIQPSIAADGLVTLDIRTEVSSVADPETAFPTLRTREATTRVRVRDGDPLIIGGLIQEEERERMSGIPLLSELPVLGSLFGKRVVENVQTETIIILVPHIVHDGGGTAAAGDGVGAARGGADSADAAVGAGGSSGVGSGAERPLVVGLGGVAGGKPASRDADPLHSLGSSVMERWTEDEGGNNVTFDLMTIVSPGAEVQFEKQKGRTSWISRLYAGVGPSELAWSVGASVRYYAADDKPYPHVRPWIDAGAEYASPLHEEPQVVYTAGAGFRVAFSPRGLLELYARHQAPSDAGALDGLPGREPAQRLGLKVGWRY